MNKKIKSVKIAIIEDHEDIRNTLSFLLNGQNNYKVIASEDSVENAIRFLKNHIPDIILLDLGLPGLSGVNAVKLINNIFPTAMILIYTITDEDEQVFNCLKAGASGYILKESNLEQIIYSIKELISGGAPMSYSIAKKVVKEFQQIPMKDEFKEIISPLSKREEEILKSLYQGLTYKEIANKLLLSTHTIHSHIKHIYNKLQANSRSEAVYKAHKKKLI